LSSAQEEEVRYVALVPARVAYDGKRAEKARDLCELHEDGFHGARVDCRDCGTVATRTDVCPLCRGPGPLRARPG
jgi:rubrerythrin